ncbi:MAG: gamma-glutamyl-gamma-aminobutyrate hydrolase family protein [Eubacteriales bacterium]|nr:gamma-glutamyl-gamma-aminobutyrate hydrolase family protein [Eubacteriales bacterium]
MTKRPIIGVTPLFEGNMDLYKIQASYMDSVLCAGGVPVILPITSDDSVIENIINVCDGILVTGGHDIEPELYGEQIMDGCDELCPERDALDFRLTLMAINVDKPMLAVCRGMHMVNVVMGGTLYQDIPTQISTDIEHNMPVVSDDVIHEVRIERGTPLMDILKEENIMVNSYHNQCVKKIGSGLEVSAVCPDGIIEGIFMPDKRYIHGLQWHPEKLAQNDKYSQRIIESFVKACSNS